MSWYSINYKKSDLVEIDFIPKNKFQKLKLFEAAQYTIQQIVRRYPAPYTLLLSGGVDSQVMLYSWIKSGVDFNTLSVTYNKDYNSHDLKELIEFSKIHSIEINYDDLDLFYFLENELNHYALTYQCTSPQICTHIKICEMVKEGTVLLSGNCLVPYGNGLTYAMLGIHRYSLVSKIKVIPYFLLETPEIAYSMFNLAPRETETKKISRNEYYQYSGYPIISQDSKITGFEKYKDFYEQQLFTVKERLTLSASSLYFSKFDKKFRAPYHRFIKNTVSNIHTLNNFNLTEYYVN